MNKKDFIRRFAAKAGLSVTAATKATNAFMKTVTETCAEGDDIRFIGFGTFFVKDIAARTVTNPKTREEIEIAAHRLPKFVPGTDFKKAVNK